MKTKRSSKVTAIGVACVMLLSGASAVAASTRGSKAGSAASAAAAKKCKKNKKCAAPTGFVPGRVVELTYEGPAIGSANTPTVNVFGALSPVNFIPGMGETLATIEIIDDNTPKASASFSYDSDGDGLNDAGPVVCGKTPEPIEMLPGTQYNVFPYLLPSTDCTDAVATSGKIIVTFNKV